MTASALPSFGYLLSFWLCLAVGLLAAAIGFVVHSCHQWRCWARLPSRPRGGSAFAVDSPLSNDEQRLELALDAANTCTWDIDFVHDRLTLDARWSRMLGGPLCPTVATRRQMLHQLHPEDRARVIGVARTAQDAPGPQYTVEQRVRNQAGRWVWIKSTGRVIERDAHGRAVRAIGTNTDVTALKAAELELVRRKEFLATLQRTTLDLLQRRGVDEVLPILVQRAAELLNSVCCELLLKDGDSFVVRAATANISRHVGLRVGVSREEATWQAHRAGCAVLSDDDRGPVGECDDATAAPTAGARFPVMLDGRCVGALALRRPRSAGIFDPVDEEHGQLLAHTAALVLHNAALREQALRDAAQRNAALRESEERFRLVFDQSPIAIALMTYPEGEIVAVNEATCAQFRVTRQQVIGRTTLELGVWTDEALRARYLEELRLRGRTGNFTSALRRSDGSRFESLFSGSLIEIGTRQYTLNSIQDVTDLRNAEEERKSMEAQMRHAQKMESLGTLAGGIAHDFNNILTGIFGFLDLARREVRAGHPAEPLLHQSIMAAQRARDLVAKILTFSRRHDGERRSLSVGSVIEEVAALLRSTLPAEVEFVTQVDKACPMIVGDPTQIHQALMNLCTNAWHAIPQRGGSITVKLEPGEISSAMAARQTRAVVGPAAKLSVIDNGCGMDEATLARIFEPFFTTKEPGKGTGLGLSVVHGIVASHDGAIMVRSAPNEGACFSLYFPALRANSAAAPLDVKEGEPPHGFGEQVMWVDDDPMSRVAVARTLASLGYKVSAFGTAESALAAFRTAPDRYALVVTDLSMPGIDGEEFTAEVVRISPSTPVLMLTGYAERALRSQESVAGVREVVVKPPTRRDLAVAIRRHLTHRESSARPMHRGVSGTGGR